MKTDCPQTRLPETSPGSSLLSTRPTSQPSAAPAPKSTPQPGQIVSSDSKFDLWSPQHKASHEPAASNWLTAGHGAAVNQLLRACYTSEDETPGPNRLEYRPGSGAARRKPRRRLRAGREARAQPPESSLGEYA